MNESDFKIDESSDEDIQAGQVISPRKRRPGRKPELDSVLGLPLDAQGFLDIETFCSEDFDWFSPVKQTIRELCNPEQVSPRIEPVEEVLNKPRFSLDLSNLELTQVIKHRRLSEEEDEEDEEEVPSSSTSCSSSAAVQQDPNFKTPKSKCRKFIFKPFRRTPQGLEHDDSKEPVDVIIPEQLAASYGLYLWPCAPVLAWYLWLRQEDIKGKKVLELGSGTALPGLLCAKFGADQVFLTDDAWQINTLKNIHEAVKINKFQPDEAADKVQVLGLTWGDYTEELFDISESKLDFIIGSDLFFDPEVFEPLITTISYLLELNPNAEVLIAVQERSSDWSIEEDLIKWSLKCSYIFPKEFLSDTGIEEGDLTGKHSIFILKIFPADNNHGC